MSVRTRSDPKTKSKSKSKSECVIRPLLVEAEDTAASEEVLVLLRSDQSHDCYLAVRGVALTAS